MAKVKYFQWEAVNKKGDKRSGSMEAENADVVRSKLLNESLLKPKVKPISKKEKEGGSRGKVTSADVTVFSRQLYTMLKSGVPLVQALGLVRNTIKNPKMKYIVSEIEKDVSGGIPFSQALKKHPEQFDSLFVNLVAVGEASGKLDSILDSMATYLEKSENIRKKIKKALSYPIAVIFVSFIVTLILMIKVVPSFENMFKSFGGELPLPTQIIVNASEFTQSYYMYMIAAVAGFIFGLKYLLKNNKEFKRSVEFKVTQAPIFGNIVVKSAVARFARTLSTTFAAGVPMVQGLTSAAPACGNAKYIEAVYRVRDDVETGVGMSFSMEEKGVFPDVVVQMVKIGEETGQLDSMLDKAAQYFEEEVDASVDAMTSMIEPLVMAILGVLIGGIIVAMYLPIFEMGKNI